MNRRRFLQLIPVYLPLVSLPAPPPASIRFGSGVARGALSGVGAAFPAGTLRLYYDVTIPELPGASYRERWELDGVVQGALGGGGTTPADGSPRVNAIALSSGAALPSGRYRLTVLLEAQVAGSAEAQIG